MTTVDTHSHLGWDEIFDHDFPADALVQAQEANGVNITIVQPGLWVHLADTQRQHDAIAAFAAAHPGRFVGMANPNPHMPDDDYRREVTRCVRELGFVGVKIHPFAHAVNPAGRAARKVYEIAAELDIPVMIHTGAGAPWALPSTLIEPAQAFPHVPMVLAHAGASVYAAEALLVAKLCPNIYWEPSWTGGFNVREFVRACGAHRCMMGSDHADNQATEIAKFRTCGLTEDEQRECLGAAAVRLYKLGEIGNR